VAVLTCSLSLRGSTTSASSEHYLIRDTGGRVITDEEGLQIVRE